MAAKQQSNTPAGSEPRSLYGADAIADLSPGSVVYLVESMIEVDAGQKAGLPVVCVPRGDGGGWYPEYSQQLAGLAVVCVPSTGLPGVYGTVKWGAIAREIARSARSVRMLALTDGDGVAVTDLDSYLEQGHSATEFVELAQAKTQELAPTSARGTAEAWEAPTALDLVAERPAFPVHVLPPSLRAFVESEAEFTQTPVDLAAMVVLGVLATTAGGRVIVEGKPGWREGTNLFLAPVMEPGERKSAVFRDCLAPVQAHESDLIEKARPDIARAHSRYEVAEKRLAKLQEAASKATSEEAGDLGLQAEAAAVELLALRPPPEPCLSTSDVTPEALGTLLADHDGRMAVLSAEGGAFDQMTGIYTNGRVNLDAYLKGHAGDEIKVHRKGRPPEMVNHPALTVCVTAQPEALAKVHHNPAIRGRGLLDRFLFAFPLGMVGRREMNPPCVGDATRASYEETVKMLARSLDEMDGPLVLHLSDEAATPFLAFRTELEQRRGDGGDLAYIKSWASKLDGAVLRLAGLLHVAGRLADGFGQPIDEATMASAIEIARYLITHALIAFDCMGSDEAREDARAVLEWAGSNKEPKFTRREAQRALHRRFPRVADIDPALGLLVEHGFIRSAEKPSAPGRPSPSYLANPLSPREVVPMVPKPRS